MEMLLVLIDVITYSNINRHPALLTQVNPWSSEHGAIEVLPERLYAERGAAEVLTVRTIAVTLHEQKGVVRVTHLLAD